MADQERRSVDRRVDPNVWSPQHKRQVQAVYAMAVGGVIVLFGLVIISWAVISPGPGEINLIAVGIGASICLLGLVASMPKTFMPILSFVLKRIPFLKGTAPTPNEIAAISGVIDLVPEDPTDVD